MNPLEHSDVASAIYKVISETDDLDITTQEGEGTLSCRIADMLAKDFDVELQPSSGDIE